MRYRPSVKSFRQIDKHWYNNDIIAVFRRKNTNPESQATAKHKWHKLVFDPNTMKPHDVLEELNQSAEKVFGKR